MLTNILVCIIKFYKIWQSFLCFVAKWSFKIKVGLIHWNVQCKKVQLKIIKSQIWHVYAQGSNRKPRWFCNLFLGYKEKKRNCVATGIVVVRIVANHQIGFLFVTLELLLSRTKLFLFCVVSCLEQKFHPIFCTYSSSLRIAWN